MSDVADTLEDTEGVANEVAPPAPEPVKPPAVPPKAVAKQEAKKAPAVAVSEPAKAEGVENESFPAAVAAVYISEGQHQLARRVAADAFEASKNRDEFAKAFIADKRLDGTTDAEGQALLVAGYECVAYWLANKIEKPTAHIPDYKPQPVQVVPVV